MITTDLSTIFGWDLSMFGWDPSIFGCGIFSYFFGWDLLYLLAVTLSFLFWLGPFLLMAGPFCV